MQEQKKNGRNIALAAVLIVVLAAVVAVVALYQSWFAVANRPKEGEPLFSLRREAVSSITLLRGYDGGRAELTEEAEIDRVVEAINGLKCGEVTPNQPAKGGYDRAVTVHLINGETYSFCWSTGYVEIATWRGTYTKCACNTSALRTCFIEADMPLLIKE